MKAYSGWLVALVLFGLLLWRTCSPAPEPVLDSRIDTLIEQVAELKDSLQASKNNADTAFVSVIDRTHTLKQLTVEYRTQTDTILKLQACDQLVVQVDSLVEEVAQADSARLKERALADSVIAKQDTVIGLQSEKIDQQSRLLRRWKIGAGTLGAAVVVLLLTR